MCQKPKKGMSKMIIEQNVQKCYILPFQCFIINFVTIFPSHVNFTHSNNISTKYELVSTLLARDNRKNVIFAILLLSCLARLFMNAFICCSLTYENSKMGSLASYFQAVGLLWLLLRGPYARKIGIYRGKMAQTCPKFDLSNPSPPGKWPKKAINEFVASF